MIGLLEKTGIGSFLSRREIHNRLKRAEEFHGTSLGKHLLEKAKEERASATNLSADDLEAIDLRIKEVESKFQ